MKVKNKGKVHPSPPPSAIPSSSRGATDVLSLLIPLPAAILALVSLLPIQDREVLAYMITRSIRTTAPSSVIHTTNKKSQKKPTFKNIRNCNPHKPLSFDCDCFDCYTSFWFRWDSSPNRELIHQAIEAFEDHLAVGEKSSRNSGRGKKKHKMDSLDVWPPNGTSTPVLTVDGYGVALETSPSISVTHEIAVGSQDNVQQEAEAEAEAEEEGEAKQVEVADEATSEEEEGLAVVGRTAVASNHKGLARKVLPDVFGLLNSRLWSLLSPNV